MKTWKTLALMVGVLLCCIALAAPAPWYFWRSKFADYFICSQNSPGDGWVAVKGPFHDAQCKKPVGQ